MMNVPQNKSDEKCLEQKLIVLQLKHDETRKLQAKQQATSQLYNRWKRSVEDDIRALRIKVGNYKML